MREKTLCKIHQIDGITYTRSIQWDWLMAQQQELEDFLKSRLADVDILHKKFRKKETLHRQRPWRLAWVCVPAASRIVKEVWGPTQRTVPVDIEEEAVKKAKKILEAIKEELEEDVFKHFKILKVKPL